MKKIFLSIILILSIFILSGCGNEYKGTWCRYDEVATIIILLNDNATESDKTKINDYINNLDNIISSNYYSKESYADKLGVSVDDIDIYANYFVSFNSLDNIGTYVSELSKFSGVKEARQSDAKDNMNLYTLNKDKTYTYSESDDAKESEKIKGTYKIKKGIIIFKPDNKKLEEKLLYTKDGYLCEDADCTKIFFRSTNTCEPIEEETK